MVARMMMRMRMMMVVGENGDENENDDLAESGFDFSKKRCRLDQITGAGQVDNYLMFQI